MPYAKAMADLYSRLADIGFPAKYVREHILPEWWEDRFAAEAGNRRLVEIAIAQALQVPLGDLIQTDTALSLTTHRARFRRWQGTERDGLAPSVAISGRIARLLPGCLIELPPCRARGLSAAALRAQLLAEHDLVSFEVLVDACWSLGVPVVYLESLPAGARVDGMALKLDQLPVIILASGRKGPSWLIWHLAHELGHVASCHLEQGDMLDVEIGAADEAREEKEANAYAKELLYGSTALDFKAQRYQTAETVAAEARRLSKIHNISPGCIVTNYAFNMQAWAVAQKALKLLGEENQGADIVRRHLAAHLDLDALSETERHFLTSVIGLPD